MPEQQVTRIRIRAPQPAAANPSGSVGEALQLVQYAADTPRSAVLVGRPTSRGAFRFYDGASAAPYTAVSEYRMAIARNAAARVGTRHAAKPAWFALVPLAGGGEMQAEPIDEVFSVRRAVDESVITFVQPTDAEINAALKLASRPGFLKYNDDDELDREEFQDSAARAEADGAMAGGAQPSGRKGAAKVDPKVHAAAAAVAAANQAVRAVASSPAGGASVSGAPSPAPAANAGGPGGSRNATPALRGGDASRPAARPLTLSRPTPTAQQQATVATAPEAPAMKQHRREGGEDAAAAVPEANGHDRPSSDGHSRVAAPAAPQTVAGAAADFVRTHRGRGDVPLKEVLTAIMRALPEFGAMSQAEPTARRAWFDATKNAVLSALPSLGCALIEPQNNVRLPS